MESIDHKLDDLRAEKEKAEAAKLSLASSQVIAANRTLKADPNASKYTDAAIPALDVAQSGLPMPTVEDLLAAMEIQAKFLSGQVDAAQAELNKVNAQIAEKDKIIGELKVGISDSEKAKIDALEKFKEKVRVIDEDNSWTASLNPFHGLWKGLKKLLGWVFAFVVLGGLLKVGSIFFPQLEIIRWIGRILVYPFKLFLMWIPEAFRALGAVPHAEFLKEKELADRTVGAIQELKDSSTDAYAALRPKLLDWMKDRPEFKEIVDQKLIALNLK